MCDSQVIAWETTYFLRQDILIQVLIFVTEIYLRAIWKQFIFISDYL